jgi:hypothetical protein
MRCCAGDEGRARDVKQAPSRPETDKLDAVWLAKLTERGMLRPSFVPPAEIRHRPGIELPSRLSAWRAGHGRSLRPAGPLTDEEQGHLRLSLTR